MLESRSGYGPSVTGELLINRRKSKPQQAPTKGAKLIFHRRQVPARQTRAELDRPERMVTQTRANAASRARLLRQDQARLARARLAAIVESSSDAILSRSLGGTITSWNQGAERLFGYSSREIIGRPSSILIPGNRVQELRQIQRRLECGQRVGSIETVRVRKDGRRIDVSLTLSAIKNAAGRITGFSEIARGVASRQGAEKALRESESRLQAIMDNSPAMIFLKDRQGRYLHVNRQFERVFRLPVGQTVGKTDAEIFPPKQAAAFQANDRKVLQAGIPMVFDEVAVHADGPRASLVTKFPLYDGEGKIYALGGIVTDATERRRLESEILRIREREQQRIAQDLHDGLGQQLTGIVHLAVGLQASLARRCLSEAADAARIVKLLDNAVIQTRSLARGLHPVPREALGLMSSLEHLAAMVTDLFRIDCRFHCRRPVFMHDNAMATHLYRIAQEAINNAIKHGRSTEIRIVLADTSDKTTLTVKNNGLAISKQRSRKEDGLGLRIMQYRAGMMGGSLSIESHARRGTTLTCTIPKG